MDEIQALKSIDDALSKLDETARKRVFDWVSSKYDFQPKELNHRYDQSVEHSKVIENPPPQKLRRAKTKGKKTSKITLKMIKELNLKPQGKKSLRDFIEEKSPSNAKQKCTVAIYYMKNIMNIEHVSVDHVYTAFKSSEWPVPANLPNTLHQAGSEGWLNTADIENLLVTPSGENLIEYDLPKSKG